MPLVTLRMLTLSMVTLGSSAAPTNFRLSLFPPRTATTSSVSNSASLSGCRWSCRSEAPPTGTHPFLGCTFNPAQGSGFITFRISVYIILLNISYNTTEVVNPMCKLHSAVPLESAPFLCCKKGYKTQLLHALVTLKSAWQFPLFWRWTVLTVVRPRGTEPNKTLCSLNEHTG